MKEILVLIAFLMFSIFGYFLMGRLDKYLRKHNIRRK